MAPEPFTSKPLMLRALIVGRSMVAASSLLAPRLAMRLLQIPGDGTPAPAIARLFGIRNAVLAVGLYRLDLLTNRRAFLWVNALIDAVDALAFLEAGLRRDISPAGAAIVGGIATAATVAGVASALQTPADPAH